MSSQDNYGYFGPNYSFADNIALPGDIGVRVDSSFGSILDAVGGVNHYIDVIAFGSATGFDGYAQSPMGIRYFLDTGLRCSNGASMSDYFDGVTKGDLLGDNVKAALASAGLPGLQGLAPGMLENARDALDPRPIFSAVTGTGYPVCQQIQCPVGTVNGQLSNPNKPSDPYILGDVQNVNGMPMQTRWVQAYDQDGSAISISKGEFAATPKCYNPDGSYMKKPPTGCPPTAPAATATPAQGKYALCTQVQGATMPPTLKGGVTAESFQDIRDNESTENLLVGLSVAALVGIFAWSTVRRR